MVPASDGADDFVGAFCPSEKPRVLVCLGEEAVDSGLQGDEGTEHAALQAPLRQLGEAALDSVDPRGRRQREMEGEAGLLLGAMHELHATGPVIETGAAPALFAAGILARHPGPVLWITRSGGVFAHGLVQTGLDPRRIVFVDAGRSVLLAMEEALRHPDVSGVVCELEGKLDLAVSRRLQLAAQGSQGGGKLPSGSCPCLQNTSSTIGRALASSSASTLPRSGRRISSPST